MISISICCTEQVNRSNHCCHCNNQHHHICNKLFQIMLNIQMLPNLLYLSSYTGGRDERTHVSEVMSESEPMSEVFGKVRVRTRVCVWSHDSAMSVSECVSEVPKNRVSVSESASDTDSDTNSCPKSCPCPFISGLNGEQYIIRKSYSSCPFMFGFSRCKSRWICSWWSFGFSMVIW